MTHDPHDALLRLLAAGGPAEPRRRLLDACGSPADALASGVATWRAHGLSEEQIAALWRSDGTALERAKAWLAANPARHLLGWHDPD